MLVFLFRTQAVRLSCYCTVLLSVAKSGLISLFAQHDENALQSKSAFDYLVDFRERNVRPEAH